VPKTFIIAEIGVNHNGSAALAKTMIDAAAACGVDAVKFQTFKAENLVSLDAPKAEYQKRNTGGDGGQFNMLKALELDYTVYRRLKAYSRRKNVKFISTPFDLESAAFLHRLGVGVFKIPSGEITNLPYLRLIGSFKKKIILSTGMSNLSEVRAALRILEKSGTRRENIVVLHCNTDYPTPFHDVNLRAMQTMSTKLGVKIGYSDHTTGIEVSVAAVALGASVIEKHFTLDRRLPGPDHKASLEPAELRALVAAVRNVEAALGSAEKRVTPSEKKNILVARKSLVAARDIRKGEKFTLDNLAAKRPGSGMSPMLWDKVIGRRARRAFARDERIAI